jgi:hypothetical protein
MHLASLSPLLGESTFKASSWRPTNAQLAGFGTVWVREPGDGESERVAGKRSGRSGGEGRGAAGHERAAAPAARRRARAAFRPTAQPRAHRLLRLFSVGVFCSRPLRTHAVFPLWPLFRAQSFIMAESSSALGGAAASARLALAACRFAVRSDRSYTCAPMQPNTPKHQPRPSHTPNINPPPSQHTRWNTRHVLKEVALRARARTRICLCPHARGCVQQRGGKRRRGSLLIARERVRYAPGCTPRKWTPPAARFPAGTREEGGERTTNQRETE